MTERFISAFMLSVWRYGQLAMTLQLNFTALPTKGEGRQKENQT
jgi:hypothetical protein